MFSVTGYVDCEFNEYGGDLISMAIYVNKDCYFYEVLECSNPTDWVKDNVLPVLDKKPISYEEFQTKLEAFITQFKFPLTLVVDWAEDLVYLSKSLLTGSGKMLSVDNLTFRLMRVDTISEKPHNALADAKGIYDYIEKEKAKYILPKVA